MLTATTSAERLTDGIVPTRLPNRTVRGHERVGARSRARRGDPRASLAEAAVLQERARIARELHDSVAQTLYAITLSASRARSLSNATLATRCNRHRRPPAARERRTDRAPGAPDGHARRALTSGDLVSGLTNLAADMRARDGLDVRLSLSDDANVPPAIGEELVIIAREALHNVVKHAGAGRVDITVEVDSRELCLTIADHGRGFDPAVPRPGHFGLQSMWERAAAVGGTLGSAAWLASARECVSAFRCK